MCAAFGVEGADDPRVATARDRFVNRDAMTVIMDQVYAAAARMTTAEAIGALEANNVPCGVVLSPEDLLADRHVLAIGMIEEHQHPAAGRIRQPRHPAQFATTPARAGGPAPGLGEHTDEILAEIGLADRIADLRARSVVS
jgi:crotonobetainyl-CoA:carnitine CoA-transferase CaiB-like acyl-CoA transferase